MDYKGLLHGVRCYRNNSNQIRTIGLYRLMLSIGLWRRYFNITITILDIMMISSFIWNSTQLYRFVYTSQETHYVSATRPTG
jgi:hypothetical protein